MNPHPKVSVILTSYNHAKYLREAIESVLLQTFEDFELIIWDDASTDASWEVINEYSDLRIRTFRNETNLRLGNINRALEKAVGEYVAIHHSDDVWETDKLQKQVAYLNAHPDIGAVFTWAKIIDEDGQSFKDEKHFYHKIFDQPNRSRFEWLNHFFYQGNALCHPSVLIRKDCYDDCGLYRYGLAQTADFDMWVRLCFKYEINVIQEKLVRFRIRSNEMNISGNRLETNIRAQFEFLQILKKYRDINTQEELIKIFPTSEKYFSNTTFDAGFALGMVALGIDTLHIVKLFGLELLFDVINDPNRVRKANELGFGYMDFIALTAKNDVFLVELRAGLAGQVAGLAGQVEEKDRIIQEQRVQLSNIHTSRAWRSILFLRKIRASFYFRKQL